MVIIVTPNIVFLGVKDCPTCEFPKLSLISKIYQLGGAGFAQLLKGGVNIFAKIILERKLKILPS